MQLAPETAVELERAFDVYHDFEHDVEQKSEEIQTILDLYDALGNPPSQHLFRFILLTKCVS